MSEFTQDNPLTKAVPSPVGREESFPKFSLRESEKFSLKNHPHLRYGDNSHVVYEKIKCCTSTGRFVGRKCDRCDPCCEGRESNFAHMGSGVSAYFKNQKWLIWTFFFMSIFTIPQILINVNGIESEEFVLSNALAELTLGRFKVEEGSKMYFLFDGSTSWPVNVLGPIYVFCDIAALIFFIISWFWLRRYENKEEELVDRDHTTADDFAVYLPWVPPNTTEADVRDLVRSVVEMSKSEAEFKLEQEKGEESFKIADIYLVEDQMAFVNYKVTEGRLDDERNRLKDRLARINRLPKERLTGICNSFAREKKMLEHKIAKLDERINYLYQNAVKDAADAPKVAAFITFEREDDAAFFLAAYPEGFSAYCCQSRPFRLRKEHRIRVLEAPPPSAIIWENMNVTAKGQCLRQTITGIIITIMLLGSFFLLWLASSKQKEFTAVVTVMSQCFAGAYFRNYTNFRRINGIDTNLTGLIAAFGKEHYQPYRTCWCVFDSHFATIKTYDTYFGADHYIFNESSYDTVNTTHAMWKYDRSFFDKHRSFYNLYYEDHLSSFAYHLQDEGAEYIDMYMTSRSTFYTYHMFHYDDDLIDQIDYGDGGGGGGGGGGGNPPSNDDWTNDDSLTNDDSWTNDDNYINDDYIYHRRLSSAEPTEAEVADRLLYYTNDDWRQYYYWDDDWYYYDDDGRPTYRTVHVNLPQYVRNAVDTSKAYNKILKAKGKGEISDLTGWQYDYYLKTESTTLCPYQGCPTFIALDFFRTISLPECSQWWEDRVATVGVTIAASLAIAIVNFVLQKTMRYLATLEGHHSFTELNTSLALRLLAATFFNTTILTIIINAAIPPILPIMEAGPAAKEAPATQFSDFEVGWYTGPGAQLITNLLVNSVSVHAAPIIASILSFLKVKKIRKQYPDVPTVTNQRQLDELFEGAQMDFAARYALMWNTLFSAYLLSSGLPLTIPIACGSFFISYWVDKTLFRTYYALPPAFAVGLQRRLSGLIPFLWILHTGVGAWMLSKAAFPETIADLVGNVSDIVSNATGSNSLVSDGISRLSEPVIIPVVAILALMVGLLVARTLAMVLGMFVRGFAKAIYNCICCRNGLDAAAESLEVAKKKENSKSRVLEKQKKRDEEAALLKLRVEEWNALKPVLEDPTSRFPDFVIEATNHGTEGENLDHDEKYSDLLKLNKIEGVVGYNILYNPELQKLLRTDNSAAKKYKSLHDFMVEHNAATPSATASSLPEKSSGFAVDKV